MIRRALTTYRASSYVLHFNSVQQVSSMAAASSFPTKQFAMGAKSPGGKLELVSGAHQFEPDNECFGFHRAAISDAYDEILGSF